MATLEEELYCYSVANSQIERYCHGCLGRGSGALPLMRCIACKFVNYCGASCQKKDWKLHKMECSALKECVGDLSKVSDAIRFVLRLAQKWARGDFGETDVDGVNRSVVTMEYHKSDPFLELEASQFLNEFQTVVKKRVVGDDIIKRLFKLTNINSFALSNEFGQSFGLGLCIRMSSINHSCKPRTRMAYSNTKVKMVPTTLNNIPSTLFEAEHSYIDELRPKSERKRILKEKYKFDCSCEGCKDDQRNALMEAWECQNCPDGWLPPVEDTHCQKCSAIPDRDHVETCLMAMQAVQAGNKSLERVDLPDESRTILASKLLEIMEGAFYKLNVLRLPSTSQMYRAQLLEENFEKAVSFGKKLLEIHETFRGQTDLPVCYLKYGLAQVYKKMGCTGKVKEILTNDILAVFGKTFGTKSEIYTNSELICQT